MATTQRIPDAGPLQPLLDEMADPARAEDWVRCILKRQSDDDSWDKLVASPVQLTAGPAVKLVISKGEREQTETVPVDRWPDRLRELLGEPLELAHLITWRGDWHARRTKKGRWLVRHGKSSVDVARRPVGLPSHDRRRRHPLPPEHPEVVRLFRATGLYSPQGNLLGQHADKYRQVQHYLELLRPLPVWEEARSEGRPLRVVDAGCGKAYMSLALSAYAHLHGLEVELVGVDRNATVVESVRRIASDLGYDSARFEATTILKYATGAPDPVDLLVSLHACDTATDEAIAAGVRLGARAIVLAPCCQHELLGQLNERLREAPASAEEPWTAVLRHGLLRGRLADILTDALRASALEIAGYKADAIEFVAAEHTAKNLMIRAVRRAPGAGADRATAEAGRRYRQLVERWGLTPAVGALLGLNGAEPAP